MPVIAIRVFLFAHNNPTHALGEYSNYSILEMIVDAAKEKVYFITPQFVDNLRDKRFDED